MARGCEGSQQLGFPAPDRPEGGSNSCSRALPSDYNLSNPAPRDKATNERSYSEKKAKWCGCLRLRQTWKQQLVSSRTAGGKEANTRLENEEFIMFVSHPNI